MSFKKEGFTPATLEFTTSRVTLNLLVLFNPADTWPVGMLKVSFVSGSGEYLHCHMLNLSFDVENTPLLRRVLVVNLENSQAAHYWFACFHKVHISLYIVLISLRVNNQMQTYHLYLTHTHFLYLGHWCLILRTNQACHKWIAGAMQVREAVFASGAGGTSVAFSTNTEFCRISKERRVSLFTDSHGCSPQGGENTKVW